MQISDLSNGQCDKRRASVWSIWPKATDRSQRGEIGIAIAINNFRHYVVNMFLSPIRYFPMSFVQINPGRKPDIGTVGGLCYWYQNFWVGMARMSHSQSSQRATSPCLATYRLPMARQASYIHLPPRQDVADLGPALQVCIKGKQPKKIFVAETVLTRRQKQSTKLSEAVSVAKWIEMLKMSPIIC